MLTLLIAAINRAIDSGFPVEIVNITDLKKLSTPYQALTIRINNNRNATFVMDQPYAERNSHKDRCIFKVHRDLCPDVDLHIMFMINNGRLDADIPLLGRRGYI